MTDYEQQAKNFLESTGTEFKAEFLKHGKHFDNDTETRDIYKITLNRGGREYKFNFGQSINDSGFKIFNTNTQKEIKYIWQERLLREVEEYKPVDRNAEYKKRVLKIFQYYSMGCLKIINPVEPTAYDVLASLTSYDPDTFKEFCDNSYGYDNGSRKAETTYKAVVEEYKNVCMLWNQSELEQLQEIN